MTAGVSAAVNAVESDGLEIVSTDTHARTHSTLNTHARQRFGTQDQPRLTQLKWPLQAINSPNLRESRPAVKT